MVSASWTDEDSTIWVRVRARMGPGAPYWHHECLRGDARDAEIMKNLSLTNGAARLQWLWFRALASLTYPSAHNGQ